MSCLQKHFLHFKDLHCHSKKGTLGWFLYVLTISWLSYHIIQPAPLLAQKAKQTEEPSLMTREIRYHTSEAVDVFLIWGINGWQKIPEEIRPTGTLVKENGAMQTPMGHKGDTFVVKVQTPINATINYGFLVTKQDIWNTTETIWYSHEDYRVISAADGVIEVRPKSALVQTTKKLLNVFSLRQYLFGGASIVVGILFSIGVYRRSSKRIKKGILIVSANVLPIVIVFFIGEIYLRMLEMQPYARTFPGQYQNDPNAPVWTQSDPLFGWISNKNDPEMNSQGFRDAKDFDTINLKSDKVRVMVLGDSFMWGAGIARDETTPQLLQAKLGDNYEVFNLGVPGWGIDQMYLAYQQYKTTIDPDIVVLAFIDDDVDRVLESYRIWEKMNKPSFRVEDGKLVFRTSAAKSQVALNSLTKKSVFLSSIIHQIYLVNDAGPIVRHIFLDIAQETRREGRRFVVVRIPTRDHFKPLAEINRRLNNFETMFEDTDVLYLDPADEITQIHNWNVDFYLNDGHMNVTGNQFLANYIYENVFGKPNQSSDFSYSNGVPIQID